MEIVKISIKDLKPYENNVKKHPREQIEQIKSSIKKFGNNDPIAVDENYVIIEGHGRYEALCDLGYKEAECIILKGLTEEQKNAYRLVHNKLTMNSDFELDGLIKELDKITKFDMSEFDFDLKELDKELSKINDEEREVKEDNYDFDKEVEPIVKRGQIWKLGNHRLMCGDSTSKEDVSKLCGGGKIDLVFTDPPYGYEYQSNMRTKTKKFDVLKNDDKVLDFFKILKNYVNGFIFICTTWKVLDKWLPLFNNYYNLTNMIIWNKGGGGIGDLKHTFATDYEIILCSNNGKEIIGKRLGSVWEIKKDNANEYVHATQKPIKLSALAIENTTSIKDIVLDLFGGSGSTLIACEQLDRICYMMELDPHYCDVIINRFETLTGKKAELTNE